MKTPLQALRGGIVRARISSLMERRKVHRAVDHIYNAAVREDLRVTGYQVVLCLHDPQTRQSYTATRGAHEDPFALSGILLGLASEVAQARLEEQGERTEDPSPLETA